MTGFRPWASRALVCAVRSGLVALVVETNRGDRFSADFIGLGTGPLHVPKLPGIPGLESFQGHSFHTSRWDYAYTGGDPAGAPLHQLADKRVAIIGTGATAVQCVPHLARACQVLYVVQRTPSSIDLRANAPIDPDWFGGVATPGWQQRWLENFTANQAGGAATEDLVMDGWTDLSRRIRSKILQLPRTQRLAEPQDAGRHRDDRREIAERCRHVRPQPARGIEGQDGHGGGVEQAHADKQQSGIIAPAAPIHGQRRGQPEQRRRGGNADHRPECGPKMPQAELRQVERQPEQERRPERKQPSLERHRNPDHAPP